MQLNTSAVQAEAQAQNAFLAALLRASQSIAGARAINPQSLQAYRGNLQAGAERAMGIQYPTILKGLGEADFAVLIQLYLSAHPPSTGNWAHFGAHFPTWLRQFNPGGITQALPFLPDLATLESAIFDAESAADSVLQADTLSQLAGDAEALRLVLNPSVACVNSAYPVLQWLEGQDFCAPASINPQTVLVWRQGWRGQARSISSAESVFVRFCLSGATLEQAVAATHKAPSEAAVVFDLAHWISQALPLNLISHIESTSP